MEGADPILTPGDLASWWDGGLRILGLAHYGVSAYSHGTGAPGGLLGSADPLLSEMERLGVALDVSHLAERAFYESLDRFGGRVLASHSNCRALVGGDRQLSDDMIRRLVGRDGVIGSVMDAWMLRTGWQRGVSTPAGLTLDDFAAHIDHVCQIAGDARHAGIGSDLDGGYGTEQCPSDLDTIADLQGVPSLLRARGYSEEDVALIMHENWIRFLRDSLPA
jgi:membrane dipeptidase